MTNSNFFVFAQAADGAASVSAAAPAASADGAASIQNTTTPASGAPQAPGPGNMMMIPFIIVIVVMFVISMRSSSKEKKKREETINAIRKGTKVMTSGGIFGEISEVQKDQFILKIANNVQIAIARTAVAQVVQPADDSAAPKAEVIKK